MNNNFFTIITFYKFKKINNKEELILKLKNFCKFNKIKGTILVAEEGINGTIAGLNKSINEFILILNSLKFSDLNLKKSYSYYMPFQKIKVRKKKEIVTLRTKFSKPEIVSGKKINYLDWNNYIRDKETIIIDIRNEFEIKLGSFEKSINPKTKSFTEFKSFVKNELGNFKNKKIAMYCTGGIRC